MAYDFSRNDGRTGIAVELVTSIYDQVGSTFYDKKYADILWQTHIPKGSVLMDINPGAMSYVYRGRDFRGMGQFINGSSRNIPRVGQTINQVTVPMLSGAVGATVMNEEARARVVMRRAAELHPERVIFFGDTMSGFLPYIDYPTCSKVPGDTWDGEDSMFPVTQINDAMTAMWTTTKNVHLPDTVKLPPTLFSMLTRASVIGTGSVGVAVSAMNYLKENNIYTAITGQPLNIMPLRYLEGAGVAGADRVIIQQVKDENMIVPFPMPFQLAQPVPIALGVETFAEYKFGSFNMPYPASMLYLDVAQPDSSS